MAVPVQVTTYGAMSSAPRLSGDGMDSEALSLPAATKSKMASTNRHRNLKSSTKAATIAKTQAPKFVPREPVRGAIGPRDMNKKSSPDRVATMQSKSDVTQGTPARSVKESPAGKAAPRENSSAVNTYATPVSNYVTSVSNYVAPASSIRRPGVDQASHPSIPYSLPSQLNTSVTDSFQSSTPWNRGVQSNTLSTRSFQFSKPNPSHHNTRHQTDLSSLNENSLTFSQASVPPTLSGSLSHSGVPPSTVPKLSSPGAGSDVMIDVSALASCQDLNKATKVQDEAVVDLNLTPPDEERQVEGNVSDGSDKMKNEISSLKQQLDDLSKVNTDLKKLLVASVGDDLHWKMDALVRTKTQLATEIGGYTEKLMQDYEELDKLSIQADMWRSKFMATRVLIDQLSREKEDMNSRWQQAQTALQQLLQERQQLQDNMVEMHRYMKFLRDSFDPVFSRKPSQMIPNILELARTNVLLSETIKEKLLGGAPVVAAALDAGIQNGLSPAEKLAYQVLMSELNTCSQHVPGRLSAQVVSKFGRFNPSVRYEGFTFTCCRNCKGEVQVL